MAEKLDPTLIQLEETSNYRRYTTKTTIYYSI